MRPGLLARLGAMWTSNAANAQYKASLRYREVGKLLEATAAAHHPHGDAGGGGHAGAGESSTPPEPEPEPERESEGRRDTIWIEFDDIDASGVDSPAGASLVAPAGTFSAPLDETRCRCWGRWPAALMPLQHWLRWLMRPAVAPPGQHAHMFPLHKMQPWRQGMPFLHRCRVGVLQYVAFQCICATVTFMAGHFEEFYGEEEPMWPPTHLHPYMFVAKNLSQVWALYCLIYFEHSTAELLRPIKPMPKFCARDELCLVKTAVGAARSLSEGLCVRRVHQTHCDCYLLAAAGGRHH
jgi:hypothetical protein